VAVRVAIFNAAGGHIGIGETIADPASDQSPFAKACRRQYFRNRDGLLAGFPWGFARRCETLTAWSTPPADATYAYRLDPAYLKVRKLEAYLNGPAIPWRVGGVTDATAGDVTLLLTDQAATLVIATRRVENEAVWPVLFEEALSWRLASAICKELSRDEPTRQECWAKHLYFANVAMADDQQQAVHSLPDGGELYEARDGLTFGLSPAEALEARRLFPVA
jgi:hypothetical protein